MADDAYTFANTRTRLEDIVSQVRKKDTSLEKSLDLLEEGVRLANQCTELIDHADWAAADAPSATDAEPVTDGTPDDAEESQETAVEGDDATDSSATDASADDDAEPDDADSQDDAPDDVDGEDDA